MRTMLRQAPPVETEPPETPAPVDELRFTFPAVPIHARQARIWLEAWLCAQSPGTPEQVYEALIVFSELVTNSVLHGAGPIMVRARLVAWRLECEVTDRCAEMPVLLDAGLEDEHHRGLNLVDALTADWWVRANPDGEKTTCFIVELGPRRQPRTPDSLALCAPPWPTAPRTCRPKGSGEPTATA